MIQKEVTINNRQYMATPLRCKHLRMMDEILAELKNNPEKRAKSRYGEIEPWLPFIVDSIKATSEGFTMEDLAEATAQEIFDTWTTITNISGIKVMGEAKPVGASTGGSSTGDSVPPSGGHTVM